MYAVYDQVYPDTPATCPKCVSSVYTRFFDRTSVFLCASLLQNLAVPQDFYSPLSFSVGNILLTLYSMVWDYRVLREEQFFLLAWDARSLFVF